MKSRNIFQTIQSVSNVNIYDKIATTEAGKLANDLSSIIDSEFVNAEVPQLFHSPVSKKEISVGRKLKDIKDYLESIALAQLIK